MVTVTALMCIYQGLHASFAQDRLCAVAELYWIGMKGLSAY